MMISFALLLGLVAGGYVEFKFDQWMSFGWERKGSEIELTFKCFHGWCGFGLGHGMKQSDMLVAYYPEGGSPAAFDMWSEKVGQPPPDTYWGGTSDVTLVTSNTVDGVFTLVMKRGLKATDLYDKDIDMNVEMEFSYAYHGGESFSQHIQFKKGLITMADNADDSNLFIIDRKEHHRDAMTYAWFYFAPIGIVFARYFKWWSYWYILHTIFGLAAVALTFYTTHRMLLQEKNVYSVLDVDVRHHSRLSFLMDALVFGQVALGFMTRWFQGYFKILSRVSLVARLHKVMGWALLVLAFYNGALGYYIFAHEIPVLYPAAIVVTFLLLELRHQLSHYFPALNFRIFKMGEMTHPEMWEKIDEGKELVCFEDRVLEIKQFKYSHPGNAFMVYEAIGEDVGKYLLGCSSYGENFLPYIHSRQSLDMLHHLSIAKIPPFPNFFESHDDYIWEEPWQIVARETIAESTYLVSFTCYKYKMNSQCRELPWIGKHFRLKSHRSEYSRYYSCFFVDLFHLASELGIEPPCDKKPEGSAQLIVKVYDDGELTPHIRKSKIGEEMMISGPFGPGLGLVSLEGHYLGLGGGTGVIPFFDLMNYMWHNRDSVQFTLDLYFSFSKEKFAFCKELFGELQAHLQDRLNIHWLFSSELSRNPDPLIKQMQNKAPTKVWICGPSGYNRYVYKLVRDKLEVPMNKIILI